MPDRRETAVQAFSAFLAMHVALGFSARARASIDLASTDSGIARHVSFYSKRRAHGSLDRQIPDTVYFDTSSLAAAAQSAEVHLSGPRKLSRKAGPLLAGDQLTTISYPFRLWIAAASVFAWTFAGPTTAQDAAGAVPAPSQVVAFLDQTLSWNRQRAVEQQLASETNDPIIVAENRQNAAQIVLAAFEYARNVAELTSRSGQDRSTSGTTASEYQGLQQLQLQLEKDLQDTQAELDLDRRELATSSGKRRQNLLSQTVELPGEIELLRARLEATSNMMQFLSGTSANGAGGTGLRSEIEALAATVSTDTAANGPAMAGSAVGAPVLALPRSVAAVTESLSLWDRAEVVITALTRIRGVESLSEQTRALASLNRELSRPVIEELKALSARGDLLAKQADSATNAQLTEERHQLDSLAVQFKQMSAMATPLSKQGVLLGLYLNNLSGWHDAMQLEYHQALRGLGLRVGALSLAIALVLIASQLWKRAVEQYVSEPRRRRPYLALRRVVVWAVVALIIAFSFAGQLGSFVTFAGLLTAGVAVALQNVILALVGYFFLTGKYGLRVGDRVQVGGVNGEVIDMGLVRLRLLELGGAFDGPTGRVVAFSNSIVFQSTGGLYKHFPGVDLSWHELTVLLATDTNYGAARVRLAAAAQKALTEYRSELEHQARNLEKLAGSSAQQPLQPAIRLRLAGSFTEATIHYPVDGQRAAEIDERVAQEVMKEMEREPRLSVAGSGRAEVNLRTELKTGLDR